MLVEDPERVLYESPTVLVGSWRCAPGHPRFAGGWTDRPYVVFPRTSVVITQAGRDPLVADVNTVVLYNAGTEYRRERLDAIGDRCEFFSVAADAWGAVVGGEQPDPAAVFATDRARCPAASYLLQRRVVRHLRSPERVDPLFVEETVAEALAGAVPAPRDPGAVRGSPKAGSPRTRRAHRDLVEDVKALLAARYDQRLDLPTIAAEVGASPFHLARVFRAQLGTSIHAYLVELRLRRSLELLGLKDLSTLAADLGFASHSHYSAAFRRLFGGTPSQVRTNLTA